MKELEMIKAFAELEGLECYISTDGILFPKEDYKESKRKYNPIEDFYLNCTARDKYRVEIDYTKRAVFIFNLKSHARVIYPCDKAVNLAVIECILKSQGLWK